MLEKRERKRYTGSTRGHSGQSESKPLEVPMKKPTIIIDTILYGGAFIDFY